MRWRSICWLVAVVGAPILASPRVLAQKPALATRVAEVVAAFGSVEIRRSAGDRWMPARTGQELIGSDTLRTHPLAFARIKFEAGLQWVLAAESQLRLAATGTGSSNTIQVRLESGGAVGKWTPDRRPAASSAPNTAPAPRAVVETPSGQAAIEGTEWSIKVDADGRTTLVVLEGSVKLSNALDTITIRANEAAEMRVGQPPTLLRLINPRDRVQWVADYSAQPLRFADAAIGSSRVDLELSATDAAAGRTTAAIERLERVTAGGEAPPGILLALSDLLIAAGELERARLHADRGRTQHPADVRFDAMLARIALFDDRPAESRALAEQATTRDPASAEGWLALGEWARSAGDGPIARQAFQRATVVSPGDARGWFGLGSVETEFEAFVPARRWLNRALAIDPKGPGYRGELGTVETLANNFGAANREFAQALSDRRDDYVALTGRALLALKQGREPEALDLLLRATLLEPSYARARVYLGVTYYRLRRHDDAIRALRKASQLDPKDPLPYLMESAIYTDLYEPWKAMAAGRTANELMPNLKSLNQLASTQKGTANLGNSVAFFGMEPWAQHLAQESYYPFWAGSHLFLGDRYVNEFASTSEYYQGLLADPTVFGGSPLFQTLLPRSGHYFTSDVSVGDEGGAVRSLDGTLSANGYFNQRMPIGYAFSSQGARGHGTDTEPIANLTRVPASGSAAIGAAPSAQLSFFATAAVATEAERFAIPGFESPGGGPLNWTKSGHHFDAGLNYRPSPTSSVALRIGRGASSDDVPLGPILSTLSFAANPAEVQARYTRLVADRHEIAAGLELASDRQELRLGVLTFPVAVNLRDMQSAQLFASVRSRLGRTLLQADLFLTREEVKYSVVDSADGDADTEWPHHVKTALQPRLGASLRLGTAVLRATFQQRTRPWAAVSTLGPVASAGVPIDDDLIQPGGDQQRYRAQLEWEWSARTFVSAFAEHQEFENRTRFNLFELLIAQAQTGVPSLVAGAQRDLGSAVGNLRDIARDASRLNVTALSSLEGQPDTESGHASWAGVALNRVLTSRVSLASQYSFRPSSGVTILGGTEEDRYSPAESISFLPRHHFSLGGTLVSPRRFYVSAQTLYRSSRFEGYGNTRTRVLRLADWTARVGGSWESRDKRWAVEFTAADLLSKRVSTSYRLTAKVRR